MEQAAAGFYAALLLVQLLVCDVGSQTSSRQMHMLFIDAVASTSAVALLVTAVTGFNGS